MDVDQFPHPETPKVARYPIAPPGIRRSHVTPSPIRESEGHTLPHRPSGNPKAARYPIPHPGIRRSHLTPSPSGNPKVAPYPIPLRESEGRTLPHPPSGNPKVVPRPIAPPGIPTGFCHEARGCAAEALPRVKSKHINNPNGVVPMVRMGGMCCVCIALTLDIHSWRTPLPHP